MSKEFEEIVLKKLDTLEKELKINQEEIKTVHNELKETQENVKDLNNRFTVFDFEINQKIGAIFDAITVNNEKHEVFEKICSKI